MSNYIADAIKSEMLLRKQEYLCHIGIPRRSGRYPWGSGKESYQHSADFLARVEGMKKDGFTYTDEEGKTYTGDTAISKYLGMSTTEFRMQKELANIERRSLMVDKIHSLQDDGLGVNEIARRLGKNESTIRSLLNAESDAKMREVQNTADFLKEQVDKYGMVDVGKGVEYGLNVSRTKMDTAIYKLTGEGYEYYVNSFAQASNPNQRTVQQLLCKPGTPKADMYKFDKIHIIQDEFTSDDDGETYRPRFVYPKSMDPSRVMINYATPDGKGGALKDGVVEIRRGVEDLDLGGSHYAQVRILVNGTHYIKGMAVYADDLPDGVDVRFNTNKTKDVPMLGDDKKNTVLKKIKSDPKNPFGSAIKDGIFDPDDPETDKGGGQSYYYDKNGKKQLSLINKREDEGGWEDWSNKLPSQFLGKQSQQLINRQLKLTEAERDADLEEIRTVNNPVVRRKLLQDFAESCDSAAEHLKATSLPGQRYQVILPLTTLKDDEVYAPNYKDGETVALVRFPHGGTFEIPIVKVNNRNAEGNRVITKNAKDAVGINKNVADRLSGADFDGDTVMVVPCNSSRSKIKIQNRPQLADLVGFDPKVEYSTKGYEDKGIKFKKMTRTNTEMGIISNLITDMTIKGATDEELARAVKHSMVVIDAEKHSLDYKKSERDNGIAELKKKYQGHYDLEGNWKEGGASTLLSRAKNEGLITKRKGSYRIDPETGKKIYKEVEEEYQVIRDPSRKKDVTAYQKKDGNWYYKDKDKKEIKIEDTGKIKTKIRQQKASQMSLVDDARILSTGTPQEEAYASYANHLKALANEARKESIAPSNKLQYDPTAAVTYKAEVQSLNEKLATAKAHAPYERQAQRIVTAKMKGIVEAHPDMTKDEIKKRKAQELSDARARLGGKRERFEITDDEWKAIQAGAITDNKLSDIVTIVGADSLRSRALPKNNSGLSSSKQSMIKTLANNGYSNAEIASRLGVSTSTVTKYL